MSKEENKTRKKSADLIPLIIDAKDKDGAVEVLNKTLEYLYLTSNYTEIVGLVDTLKSFEKQFREISDTYRSLSVPRSYDDLHELRVELNFLYRDVSDSLSFDSNRLKIFYEEFKTVQRAHSMEAIKENADIQKKFNAKSTSAIRDIVGAHEGYNEYVSLSSISYGLFQNLQSLLNSIRQLTDSLASEEKRELLIMTKDVK